jgi:uncharacterized protein YqeY
MLEDRINQDLKQALLGRDARTATTLRGIKSAVLYAKVAQGLPRDVPTSDAVITAVLKKEAKKRQESADLYRQGGSEDRATNELAEKAIIERYLPTALDESQIISLIDEAIAESSDAVDVRSMGRIIGHVQAKAAGAADGAMIARLVKERLQ